MARIPYADRSFLLSYSTNVHPGESLADLERIIDEDVGAVKRLVFPEEPMGLNLRLGMKQIDALADEAARRRLAEVMQRSGTFLFTVNGFPIKDFHASRVKESVYTPSWAAPERADYTIRIAALLNELMPDGERVGSISSLTGCFKPEGDTAQIHRQMAWQVARVVVELARFGDGEHEIILGLEPEPFTTAETTPAFIAYYKDFLLPAAIEALVTAGRSEAEAEALTRRHLGMQLDLCHQAVQFEDISQSVRAIEAAGIRLAGVHVSAALRVESPAENVEGLAALRAYDEPRYLHQCLGADADGRVILRAVDLDRLGTVPPQVAALKCHFHVPLFQDPDGALGTTGGQIAAPLALILARDLTRHISLETYTWNVLLAQSRPGAGAPPASVHEGIAREFRWLRTLQNSV